MNDLDFDHLGDVWRQQPDPDELASLLRSAEAVRRRARWGQLVDIASAMVVGGVVLFFILLNPARDTLVVGSGAIFILLYTHYRQRRLRQEELRGLTGTAEQMIDQSIERVETAIRYNRYTLIAGGPAFLLATLFAATADRQTGAIFGSLRDTPWLRFLWVGLWVAAVGVLVVFLVAAIRRGRRELGRLRSMREAYRQERGGPAS